MAVNMKGRDFLSIMDITLEEMEAIFDLTRRLKQERLAGIRHDHILAGRKLAMIFEKPSTRTRVSFEVGAYELGMYPLYLSARDLQLGRGETIGDTARVLERYVDGIMARVFEHEKLVELANNAEIPVINGLSDTFHPCQIMADLYTVLEKKGRLTGLNMVFVGDGANNIAHSLLVGCTKVGMNITIATPEGYDPDAKIVEYAKGQAARMHCEVKIARDPYEAVKDADVIYTDVWVSMGDEAEAEKRKRDFANYQVNTKLLSEAKEDVIVLHCLPAHRGEEITDEVMDGPHSVVFDEAENRLHVQKAIMAMLIR